MHLEWRTGCEEYGLIINRAAWETIRNECAKSEKNETGGIVIGHYSEDNQTAIVCEAAPPTVDSRCGMNWFWRGINGLRSLLIDRWNQNQRTYYLGEWHYHPAKIVEPSITDIKQMIDISQSKCYQCKEPILIIVGRECNKKTPVRAFVFPKGQRRREFIKV